MANKLSFPARAPLRVSPRAAAPTTLAVDAQRAAVLNSIGRPRGLIELPVPALGQEPAPLLGIGDHGSARHPYSRDDAFYESTGDVSVTVAPPPAPSRLRTALVFLAGLAAGFAAGRRG